MCIMEVRAGQHDSTIAQAMAHNVATVVGDLEMFATVLTARMGHESGAARLDTEAALGQVNRAHDQLHTAYAGLLGLFGAEVGRHAEHWAVDHAHPYTVGEVASVVGNERLIVPGVHGHGHDAHGRHAAPVGPIVDGMGVPVDVAPSLVTVADSDRRRARKYETR